VKRLRCEKNRKGMWERGRKELKEGKKEDER
jgi:hypothetical protein